MMATVTTGRCAPLLAACGKIAPPAVPFLALVCGFFAVPPAQAADLQPAPLHAGHCVGALMEELELMTSAMVATTVDGVGRPGADPRAEMFTVPQEDAVFSIFDFDDTRSCVVAPLAGTAAWVRSDLEHDLRQMGLEEAPDCARDDVAVWVWPARNGAGRSVSVGIEGDATEVRWLMAFETLDVTDPEECKDAG